MANIFKIIIRVAVSIRYLLCLWRLPEFFLCVL